MRRKSPILLCLVALAATACGPHVALHLNMRQVDLTFPRVLTPAQNLVPPAPLIIPVPVPPIPVFTTPIQPVVPPPQTNACPKAGPFAVPAEPASVLLDKPPAPATYFQSSKGSYSGSGATPAAGKLTSPYITSLTSLPATTSQSGQQSDNWLVKRTDTGTGASEFELFQLALPASSSLAVSPGLYLSALKWKDPVRGGDLTFVPSGSGVEILPSPVSTGSNPSFASSATDPNTFTTMTTAGTVTGQQRIDVCGTLVDTYTTQLTGTLTTPNFQWQFAWRLQIATQYGGVVVEDDMTLTNPAGLTWDRTLHDLNTPEVKK
jgi:hypothetical protein